MATIANKTGHFQEKSGKRYFEFHSIGNPPNDFDLPIDWKPDGTTHIVRVSESSVGTLPCGMSPYRFAKVFQTVAYIAVDEDENGKAVWEKWQVTHFT